MDKKGCFKCKREDHWQRECPHDEKQPHFKPIPRFCDECMVSHLPLHCPRNPANQSQTNQDKGKSPLNVVQVIPSTTEDEMVVPIQVVTRAQAKKKPELKNPNNKSRYLLRNKSRFLLRNKSRYLLRNKSIKSRENAKPALWLRKSKKRTRQNNNKKGMMNKK